MRKLLSAEAFSHAIGLIYDCVLEPERWAAALDLLRRELDFATAAMTLQALPEGALLLNITNGMDPDWAERTPEYAADIVEMWGGLEQINRYPLAEPLVFSRLRQRSDIENNRWYKDFTGPRGINDALLVILARDSATVGSCAFGRHDSAGAIGDLEVEAARLLIPHLLRAVTISRLLDAKSVAASTFESALDVFAVAVVLTDADLGIVHANAAARAMLSAGGPIRSERGALAVRPPAVSAALGAAVRQAAEDEAGMGRRGLGIPAARADGTPCVLHVLPLRHGALRPGLEPRAVAAIFVAPPVSPPPTPVDALAALFDLTPAEARVFAQVAAGRTMAEIAETLGIEGTTAKTHLAHIFAKTGAHRQADLIALSAALALPLRQ